jgi:hypothetical protein
MGVVSLQRPRELGVARVQVQGYEYQSYPLLLSKAAGAAWAGTPLLNSSVVRGACLLAVLFFWSSASVLMYSGYIRVSELGFPSLLIIVFASRTLAGCNRLRYFRVSGLISLD